MANKNLSRIDRDVSQLCWVCKNACGGCEWSSEFVPVPGWDAKASKKIPGGSYAIKSCPKFEYDGQCTKCNKCPIPHRNNHRFSDICNFYAGVGNTGCFNFEMGGEKVDYYEYD